MLLFFAKLISVCAYVHAFAAIKNCRRNSKPLKSSLYQLSSKEEKSLFKDLFPPPILPEWLISSCEILGFQSPTLVQKEAIPVILSGKDVILQAQTGSGKTLSYGVPILSRIDPSRAAIQAVIIVPTRELGLQVTSVLKQLSSQSPKKIMVMSVVEGSKNRRQILWATAEPPHIVVGNPKALQRLVDMGRLRLNAVSFVVLDEVDAILIQPETRQELHRLLSRHLSNSFATADEEGSGSNPKLKESLVFKNLAKDFREAEKFRSTRQTIMCSATIPQRQHFASTCWKNGWTERVPELIHVSAHELLPAQVLHEYIPCAPELKYSCVSYILKREWSEVKEQEIVEGDESTFADEQVRRQAIVFTDSSGAGDLSRLEKAILNTIDKEEKKDSNLETNVQDSNHRGGSTEQKVRLLTDAMGLEERAESLNSFRDGSCQVLICSDLAARGLDIPNTSLVIQLSLPEVSEDYLHRAGRTGRLGRPGKVVTVTRIEQDFVIQRFQNELGIQINRRNLKVLKSKPPT